MRREEMDERLSRLSTRWSVLAQAHGPPAAEAGAAQQAMVLRYSGAVYRYLLGAVGDPAVAEDLAQEFALRLLRGDFRRADPDRGRFRDYLKTALIHLVDDYHRARQKGPQPLAADVAASPEPAEADSRFVAGWREELLERTWGALAAANPAYHAVLRLRVDQPELPSPQMAEQLTAQLGKPVTAAWARKTLQRAHDKYADLLLDEVAQSLEAVTTAALREELQELDLLKYCRAALERRGDAGAR
jgi:RNA polymerase sigma-70 factor (ECF subfamily)